MTQLTLTLDAQDVYQLLDGLENRLESWQKTLIYLKGGDVDIVIEECSNKEEANSIIKHYEKLINNIKNQIINQ